MRRTAARVLRQALRLAEALLVRSAGEPRYPSLFIVGLPRSGTTLLYQYVVHRCNVAYFTNGVEQHYYAPAVITWLRYNTYGAYVSSGFQSSYGKVPGGSAPHEAGVFWGQFFGFHDYVSCDDVNGDDVRRMRGTVAAIERMYGGRPFVTKNVKHLLRLEVLPRVFPQAHFLIIERRLEDIALSLLRARYVNLGRAGEWLSARPPNWEEIDRLPPAEQIPRQLLGLEAKLEKDLAALEPERVHRIHYDDLCAYPEGIVDYLTGIEGFQRRDTPAVKSFHRSVNAPQTEEEEALLTTLHSLRFRVPDVPSRTG